MRRYPDIMERVGTLGTVVLVRRDEDGGAIVVHRSDHTDLRMIYSFGMGWDHVSVSLEDRCPTWDEMELVKRIFFKDIETAMQLHVPPSAHINCHPFCLHLWRPQRVKIPRPPGIMVAPKGARIVPIQKLRT